MTSRDWLSQAVSRLMACGAPDARLDCEWMLCDALGIGRAQLRFSLDEAMPDGALAQADEWLDARASGVPLQYAQRCAYFMGHAFYVDERVLIPRQDTEVLCERAIALVREKGYRSVLDLCTGSGAIAASVALACPEAIVCAADISADALAVARQNAASLGARVAFAQGDLFGAVGGQRFDLIACNPPYITDEDMDRLQAEVKREPALALRGGADGLSFYRRIVAAYRDHLNPGGTLVLEVGYDQARAVAGLLGAGAFVEQDLCGVERVVGVVT